MLLQMAIFHSFYDLAVLHYIHIYATFSLSVHLSMYIKVVSMSCLL